MTTETIIPATKGFCFLLPLKNEDGKFNGEFSRIPIIAWKITDGKSVEAISVDGTCEEYAMSTPGDLYISNYDGWFDSIHDYRDHLCAKDNETE